jgi:hypothetical protein
MANVTIPYADPGRASFEEMDRYLQGFLLVGNHPQLAPAYGFPMPASTSFEQFSVLGLDANGKLAMATEGSDVGGARATGAITFSGTGTANDTVTIGARVYTLVAALTAANQVLIGASAAATANNLLAAVNGATGAGTTYGTGTVPHQDVSARLDASAVIGLVAQEVGTAGNSIATTESGTGASFGAATLTGGLNAGGIKARFVLAQAASLGASGEANGQCFYQGNFNSDALVWHESFTTDAQKAAAFFGAPTPTNIIVAKRG